MRIYAWQYGPGDKCIRGSDQKHLDRIKAYAEGVTGFLNKLKLWDYEEVLNVHEKLEYFNESINQLDLVPASF